MNYSPSNHSFVICAFGQSPFLEQCIESIENQSVKSNALIATSTPNDYINTLAEKHNLMVFVNTGESGIAGDWNYALSAAKTELVTLAHQDDVYLPHYTATMLETINRVENPVLFSGNYGELREDAAIYANRLLNIKKLLRIPMRLFPGKIWARRLSLAFGDSICCPSVTYLKSVMQEHPFKAGFKTNLDWQMWEELSKEKGAFAYSDRPVMLHRIHGGSETSRVIGETGRFEEDVQMFSKFWPQRFAKSLAAAYSSSEKSNQI